MGGRLGQSPFDASLRETFEYHRKDLHCRFRAMSATLFRENSH